MSLRLRTDLKDVDFGERELFLMFAFGSFVWVSILRRSILPLHQPRYLTIERGHA